MAFEKHDGLSMHYKLAGSGETIVMLHAGASSAEQWRKVGSHLESSYRLLLPDLYGHGETEPWRGPAALTHDDNADALRAVIEAECDGPVHMVGHSFGGATAIRFALTNPHHVRRLVLIEPILFKILPPVGQSKIFSDRQKMVDGFLAKAKAGEEVAAWSGFIDYHNGAGTWAALSEKAKASFCAGTERGIATMTANLLDPTTLEECQAIAAPILIIRGEKTDEANGLVADILHREIPDSEYVVISGAGHMSPLSHPKEVSAAIANHLGPR
jgi:pimeloyl-ACP methyl ester carboxylesterase